MYKFWIVQNHGMETIKQWGRCPKPKDVGDGWDGEIWLASCRFPMLKNQTSQMDETGGWYTYPSDKYDSRLEWWHSQLNGTRTIIQTTSEIFASFAPGPFFNLAVFVLRTIWPPWRIIQLGMATDLVSWSSVWKKQVFCSRCGSQVSTNKHYPKLSINILPQRSLIPKLWH